VVTDKGDYKKVTDGLREGGICADERRKLALKAFQYTADYDTAISGYFSGSENLSINLNKFADLRYGENPHQKAALYGASLPFEKIQGEKELSFNNFLDINSAFNIIKNFDRPAAVIIKHTVPCGAACSGDIRTAFVKALESDPMSAFGGIIGINRTLEAELTEEIIKTFFEVVIAPGFGKKGLEILSRKPNLRVVKYFPRQDTQDFRKISGGFLVQDQDSFEGEDWKVATKREPSPGEMEDLKFAWNIARFLKSNCAVLAKDGQTRGLGGGETARVEAVKIAVSKMKQFFPDKNDGLVMASDGFFPFPDAVEEAAKQNISAIVQPGGSKNDPKVIEAADRLNISMVLAGRRHFLH
jgi:phosphoribosylaminoimidazolecarboxamide formyltransferase/IMP cyclohydrolase